MFKRHLLVGCLTAAFALAAPFTAGSAYAAELDVAEGDDLLFMREEEKLARDVYLTMNEYWGNRVFANIAEAEQTHTDAIKALLDKYGLVDPALDAIGYFVNTELQALYDSLVTLGAASELAALRVGGLIEEVDMEDIKAAIDRTDQKDIRRVYENLLCGSRNHLRSYADAIERTTGETYEAQQLEQDEVDAIVESPMERCGKRR